jgi:hypothetical protein
VASNTAARATGSRVRWKRANEASAGERIEGNAPQVPVPFRGSSEEVIRTTSDPEKPAWLLGSWVAVIL